MSLPRHIRKTSCGENIHSGPRDQVRPNRRVSILTGRAGRDTSVLSTRPAMEFASKLRNNFVRRRKLTGFMFAVDQNAVALHVKDATAALNELNVNVLCIFDGGRQTGGLRGVVSLHAVFNRNLHRCPFSGKIPQLAYSAGFVSCILARVVTTSTRLFPPRNPDDRWARRNRMPAGDSFHIRHYHNFRLPTSLTAVS